MKAKVLSLIVGAVVACSLSVVADEYGYFSSPFDKVISLIYTVPFHAGTSLIILMERMIKRSVIDHLERNHLITVLQHGFLCGRSCVTQLLMVMEDWTKWADENIPFDCVYLDFRKAFDSVPHSRLLKKVEAMGIKGDILSWLTSFLQERRR